MDKKKIEITTVVEKAVGHVGIELYGPECRIVNLHFTSRIILNEKMLGPLKKSGFEIQIMNHIKHGNLSIIYLVDTEQDNCLWGVGKEGQKSDPKIDLGFSFNVDDENNFVDINPRVNGLFGMPEDETKHRRLATFLLSHNDVKMPEETRSALKKGNIKIPFEDLGINGLKIIKKQTNLTKFIS